MPRRNQPKNGSIFLGRDEATYGKEGTGNIPYDPDYECGGPPGTPDRQCPFEPKQQIINPETDNHTLHIAIPSFRDPLCPRTLYYIYTKSKNPSNIYVRVLQQNEKDDEDCLIEYCNMMKSNGITKEQDNDIEMECPYKNHIEIFPIKASDAHGPTTARSMLSRHIYDAYKNDIVHPQDFCLSMDSHMDFEPNWDTSMKKMWKDANNEYAVLSTYVADRVNIGRKNNGSDVPHLCMVTFTSNVRVHATKSVSNLPKPKLTNAVWGAGLSYMKCHAELKVGVDPHTPGIFDGEEFNRASRFWTYGYDIYTPNFTYILHDYHKSQSNPKSHTWHRNKQKIDTHKSDVRLLTLLEVPGGNNNDKVAQTKLQRSKYGLGDRRSLDQLIQFSGIDLRHRKTSIDGKNRCGNIKWVPFVEHINGVDYIPNFDLVSEDPIDNPDEHSVWYDKNNGNSNASNDNHIDDVGNKKNIDEETLIDSSSSEDKHRNKPIDKQEQSPEIDDASKINVHNDDLINNNKQQEEEEHSTLLDTTSNDKKAIYPKAAIPKFVAFKPFKEGKLSNKIRSLLRKGEQQRREHGFIHLPPFVRYSVILLVVGMFITILFTSRFGLMNGKSNKRKADKKKKKETS